MHGCVRDFNRKSKMIHQGSGSGTDISTFNDLAIFTASQFGTKSRCNKHLRQSTTGLDHMSSPKYLNTCKVTGRTRWDSESLCGSKIEHNDDIMALRFQNNAKLWGQRLSNMDILECTESLDYWERNLSHPLPWHAAATTRWEPSLHLAANVSLLGTFGKSTKHTRLQLEVFGFFFEQPRF